MWMGAHSRGGLGMKKVTSFTDIIKQDERANLGTIRSIGELPYLFKVLAADTPLSIQVHPNKHKSEQVCS